MRWIEHLIKPDYIKIESWPCKIYLRNTLPYHLSGHRAQGALWEDPDEESDNWQHVGDVSAGRHVQGTRSSRGDQVLPPIAFDLAFTTYIVLYIIKGLEYPNLIIHKQESDSCQLEGAVEEKAVEGEAEGVRPSRLRDPWGCHQTGGSQLIKLARDLTLQILSFVRKAFLSRGNATNHQKWQNIQSASLFKFCDTKIIYRLDTQSKHISEISSQIVWNGSEA